MANTLGTVNGTIIVQEALKTALEEFPILRLIARDYSPNAARWNQTINFSLVSAASTGTYSTSTGYTTQNRTQTDKQVTINNHIYTNVTINDQERSQSEAELVARFSPVVAHALFKKVVTDLFALVHSGNFTNATEESTAADIDRDTLVAAQVALDTRNTPTMGRYAVLSPTAFGELMKDSSIVSRDFRSESPSVSGRIAQQVQGFDVQSYSALSNSENTHGFAGWRDALLLATRVPESPQVGTLPGIIQTVTEPTTGLSAQLRQYYDMTLGQEFLTMTIMYGVAVGNAVFLQRIDTAS